jgi:hypothetical protein
MYKCQQVIASSHCTCPCPTHPYLVCGHLELSWGACCDEVEWVACVILTVVNLIEVSRLLLMLLVLVVLILSLGLAAPCGCSGRRTPSHGHKRCGGSSGHLRGGRWPEAMSIAAHVRQPKRPASFRIRVLQHCLQRRNIIQVQ